MVSSAVDPARRQVAPDLGDRLAVDQDVGGVRAVGGDDRAVGDERAHRSLLARSAGIRRAMVGDGRERGLPAACAQVSPSPCATGASVRSHSATVSPHAAMASASAIPLSTRSRRCVRRAPVPSSQNGSDRVAVVGSSGPPGLRLAVARPGRGAAAPSTEVSRSPAPLTSLTMGLATVGRSRESRDDVAAVRLELGLFVAVHQVEVELVDAGRRELVQLGDVLLGRRPGRRTGRSPRRSTNAAFDEPTSAWWW